MGMGFIIVTNLFLASTQFAAQLLRDPKALRTFHRPKWGFPLALKEGNGICQHNESYSNSVTSRRSVCNRSGPEQTVRVLQLRRPKEIVRAGIDAVADSWNVKDMRRAMLQVMPGEVYVNADISRARAAEILMSLMTKEWNASPHVGDAPSFHVYDRPPNEQ